VTASVVAESASGAFAARESGVAREARESAGGRAESASGGVSARATGDGRAATATGGDLWATVTVAEEESASANAGCLCWDYCCRSQNCSLWLNRSASESAPLKLINNSHERSPRPRVRAQALQKTELRFCQASVQ